MTKQATEWYSAPCCCGTLRSLAAESDSWTRLAQPHLISLVPGHLRIVAGVARPLPPEYLRLLFTHTLVLSGPRLQLQPPHSQKRLLPHRLHCFAFVAAMQGNHQTLNCSPLRRYDYLWTYLCCDEVAHLPSSNSCHSSGATTGM